MDSHDAIPQPLVPDLGQVDELLRVEAACSANAPPFPVRGTLRAQVWTSECPPDPGQSHTRLRRTGAVAFLDRPVASDTPKPR